MAFVIIRMHFYRVFPVSVPATHRSVFLLFISLSTNFASSPVQTAATDQTNERTNERKNEI